MAAARRQRPGHAPIPSLCAVRGGAGPAPHDLGVDLARRRGDAIVGEALAHAPRARARRAARAAAGPVEQLAQRRGQRRRIARRHVQRRSRRRRRSRSGRRPRSRRRARRTPSPRAARCRTARTRARTRRRRPSAAAPASPSRPTRPRSTTRSLDAELGGERAQPARLRVGVERGAVRTAGHVQLGVRARAASAVIASPTPLRSTSRHATTSRWRPGGAARPGLGREAGRRRRRTARR